LLLVVLLVLLVFVASFLPPAKVKARPMHPVSSIIAARLMIDGTIILFIG
jgi:hypothetical protein